MRLGSGASEAFATSVLSLRNPDVRRLLAGFVGSTLGTWTYAVGLAVYAYERDGAAAVGLLCLVRWGLAGALSPWLALLADRLPKRRVIVACDLGEAVLIGGVAACATAGAPSLAVYALAVLVSILGTASSPAGAALLPSLVRTPEELTSANVALSTADNLGLFAGPALAGVLLAVGSPTLVFVVAAATSLWSAACVARIGVAGEPSPEAASESISSAILTGLRAIVREPGVRLVIGLIAASLFIFGALQVLVVVVALRLTHSGSAGVGWLNAATGVGGVLGALPASALAARGRLARALAVGLLLYGLPLVLAAATSSLTPVLVLFVVVGLGGTISDVAGMTLLQRLARQDVLGRVFGALGTVSYAALAVGAGVAPLIVSALGPRGALIAFGAFLPVILALLWSRLRGLDAAAVLPAEPLSLLRAIPIFEPLSEPVLERLAGSMEELWVPAGVPVVEQGDLGDRFYVIAAGRATVEVDGEVVREVGPGDFFGEIALLRDLPRTATVRALDELRLFALERDEFLTAVTGHAPSHAVAERVVVGRLAGAPV